jgi:DNA-binding NarL/FixJ family response regulator
MIKIFIVDDHPMFIDGVKTVLLDVPDIQIAGEALNGKDALELLNTIHADIVLLDINMPVMDGLQTAELIKQTFKNVKVIMLTQYDEKRFSQKCFEMGVKGYLLKDCEKHDLVNAIKIVFNGGIQYCTKQGHNNGYAVPNLNNKERITEKEKQLLMLIAEEKCNDEIARKLDISSNTIKKRRDRLMAKAGVKNTAGLIYWAMKNNLLT